MKPDPKLINSMAVRYRHDFGFLDEQTQNSIRTTMTQLWEEVVGKGFYKVPQQETLYTEEQVFGFLDFYNSIDFNKSEYRYQPPSMDRSEKDYNKSIDRKILKEYIKSLNQPKKD